MSERLTGVLLAFASGLMIAALSFDLFEEAFELGGATRAGIGLMVGATTFVAVNAALDHHVASSEAEQREKDETGAQGAASGSRCWRPSSSTARPRTSPSACRWSTRRATRC